MISDYIKEGCPTLSDELANREAICVSLDLFTDCFIAVRINELKLTSSIYSISYSNQLVSC
jgi:hypothetical protein